MIPSLKLLSLIAVVLSVATTVFTQETTPAPTNFCPALPTLAPFTCPSDGAFALSPPIVPCLPSYYICEDSEFYLETCTKGKYFDPKKQACGNTTVPYCQTYPKGSKNKPKIISEDDYVCPAPNGHFPAVSVRLSCDVLFNVCSGNKSYIQSCMNGNVFDPLNARCVPRPYYCSSTAPDSTNSQPATTPAPAAPSIPAPLNTFTCPTSDGLFATDTQKSTVDCIPQYLKCQNQTAYLMSCYGSKVFDPIKQRCEKKPAAYCSTNGAPPSPMAPCLFTCPNNGDFAAVPAGVPCNENYQQCSGNKPYLQTCLGTVFDPIKGKCGKPAHYCQPISS